MKSSKNTCPCCKENNVEMIYDNSFFELPVFNCHDCNHYFINNLNQNDIQKYYDKTYWSVFRNIHNKKIVNEKFDNEYLFKKFPIFIQKILDLIGVRKAVAYSQFSYLKPHLRGVKLLEIGPGEGFVLELFEKNGFDVLGIEPSKDNQSIINKKLKNGKSQIGFVENLPTFDKKFDIIIMSHVLEHVIDCRAVLYNLQNTLTKNGIIFIEVPNCENKKIMTHSINMQPHIHHFTKKSLETLVKKTNFTIIRNDLIDSDINSNFDRFKYFLCWLIKKDYSKISSEKNGNEIRIVFKLQEKQ
jgi:2-polyprenyl-3-methyl-5-hydroxy-6-metoxy-1,4-benzoquinol methylase